MTPGLGPARRVFSIPENLRDEPRHRDDERVRTELPGECHHMARRRSLGGERFVAPFAKEIWSRPTQSHSDRGQEQFDASIGPFAEHGGDGLRAAGIGHSRSGLDVRRREPRLEILQQSSSVREFHRASIVRVDKADVPQLRTLIEISDAW